MNIQLDDDEVDGDTGGLWSYADQRYSAFDFGSTTARPRQRAPSQSNQIWNNDDWSRNSADDDEQVKSFSSFGFDNQQTSNNRPVCTSMIDAKYPIFADVCGAVPQARYSLPNLFGHRERWQIAQFLQGMAGATDDQACLRSLKLLLCPMVFPACSTSRASSTPVLPCQTFCRAVKAQCSITALDVFPCENLPQTSDICPNTQTFASLLSPSSFPSRSQPGPLNVASQVNTNQWGLLASLSPSMTTSGSIPMNQFHLGQQPKTDDTSNWWTNQADQLLQPSVNTLAYPQQQKIDDLTRWQQKDQTQRSPLAHLRYSPPKTDDLTSQQQSNDQVQRATLAQLQYLQTKPDELLRWQQLNQKQQQQQQQTTGIDSRQFNLLQGQNLAHLQHPSTNGQQWNFLRP